MDMRNCVTLAVAAMLLPACRSHKPAVAYAGSAAKSVSAGLAVGACSAVESVVIDEWYFYPDSIVPVNAMSDSNAMPKPKSGALARRRVMQVRRNAALTMAKDSAANEVGVSRSSSSLTGSHGIGDVTVWLRVTLVVLAVASIVAIAKTRMVR